MPEAAAQRARWYPNWLTESHIGVVAGSAARSLVCFSSPQSLSY
jgi:hypothetical protein